MYTYTAPHSASFGEIEDLELIGECISINKKYKRGGFILYSDTKKAVVSANDTHCIVFGGTGSGKTRRTVVENILFISDGSDCESIIAHLPKGDEVDKLYPHLKKRGYKVIVLNFRDEKCSDSFNPLDSVTELRRIGKGKKADGKLNDINRRMVEPYLDSSKDPYWVSQVTDYFNALYRALAVLTNNDKKLCNYNNMIGLHRYLTEKDSHVRKLCNKLNERGEKHIISGVKGVFSNASETKKNLINMSDLVFSVLENVDNITHKSSFVVEDFLNQKMALLIVSPDESTTYNGIISLFIESVYSDLIDKASCYKDAMLPNRVNFIIDEFANLPKLNDFSTMISASRSRNIRFNLICQGYRQLIDVYSESGADNILNNCETIIALQSNDIALENYLRTLIGKKTLPYSNESVDLLYPGLLRKQKKGDAIVVAKGIDPIKVRFPDISEYDYDYTCSGYLNKERENIVVLVDWNNILEDDSKGNADTALNNPFLTPFDSDLELSLPTEEELDKLMKELDDAIDEKEENNNG